MTIYHSEPYKETTPIDPESFREWRIPEIPPYSSSPSLPVNDRPHMVYCQHCAYKITIEGLAGPRCGRCNNHLITFVKRDNELVKRIDLSTQGA